MARNFIWCFPRINFRAVVINANLCDLFITASHYDIANYADDNTPYVSGKNIEEVVASLEDVSEIIFQ